MRPESATILTETQCADLVAKYLAGQDWRLAVSSQLAAEIWQQLAKDATQSAVQTELLRRYAALLHDCCRQQGTSDYNRAWQELQSWLEKNAPRLESHSNIRQEIVQESLISLQNALSKSPLDSPQTFLIFAFQTMRRQHIDLNRRQTAEKRDWRNTISLESLGRTDHSDRDPHWTEYLSASAPFWRTIEHTVSNQEIRQQLRQFAQEQLPTELQRQVFESHFLDGLKPAEIAPLLGKKPHEIRLLKARIVRKLRELPQADLEQLLEILGELKNDV